MPYQGFDYDNKLVLLTNVYDSCAFLINIITSITHIGKCFPYFAGLVNNKHNNNNNQNNISNNNNNSK